MRRFAGLWERGRTRELPELDEVTTAWLGEHLPESGAPSIVHGDFRIGNLLFCGAPPVRLLGIVDWEMATLGDPLADVGYLCAELTGRGLENLGWYRVLAVWKSAIFLEQSYQRYLAGNEHDPWFAEMADGRARARGAGSPGGGVGVARLPR